MKKLDTLADLFEGLDSRGSRDAVVALGQEEDVRWSGEELLRRSSAAGRRLLSEGLEPGDRVAVIGQNGPAWIVACLGCLRAGGTVVPIDVQFGEDTLEGVLNDAKPKWIACGEKTEKRLGDLDLERDPERLPFGELTGDSEESEESEEDWPTRDADDVATIFYTSGTTGAPKGVPLTHKNLVHQLNVIGPMELIRPDERMLLPLPLHHVYAFSIGMLLPLHLGVAIIMPAALTGPQIVRALKEEKVDALIGVPRLYRALRDGIESRVKGAGLLQRQVLRSILGVSMLMRRNWGLRWGGWLAAPLRRRLGPRLRVVASGGSPLEDELAYFLESLGWQLATGYGLTETAPLLTMDPPGKARIGSVGKPIEGIEIMIDPSGQSDGEEDEEEGEKEDRAEREGGDDGESAEAEEGQSGEVLARGPSVFKGYLNLEEESEESFTEDGWFKTGDLGYLDEDGYLHLSGRASSLIVTEGGENLQPEQVEEAYEKHAFIKEAGVLQHDGELVALIVPEAKELRRASQDDAKEAIREAVEEISPKLPSYQRINDFVVSGEAIERTRLGKIRRKQLKERYEKAAKEGDGEEEKQHPIEIDEMSSEDQELLEEEAVEVAWKWLAERFHDRRLTPDTSPQIDLGIDSMEWLNLSMELRQRVGVELTEEEIGEIETVRDLLKAVHEGEREEGEGADPFDDPEERLSEEQRKALRPLGPAMGGLSAAGYSVNRFLIRVCFGLEVAGLDRLPDQPPYLIAPNHRSYLDGPTVAAALDNRRLRQVQWTGAAGIVLSNPVMRLVTRLARIAPVDTTRAGISSLACGAILLKKERAVVWFPEGRLSPTGKLGRFRPGVGLLADRFGPPIVPVWIEGTEEALGPGKFWPRFRRRLKVTFGEPLDPEELEKEGDGDEPHQRIVSALRERMQKMGDEEEGDS